MTILILRLFEGIMLCIIPYYAKLLHSTPPLRIELPYPADVGLCANLLKCPKIKGFRAV